MARNSLKTLCGALAVAIASLALAGCQTMGGTAGGFSSTLNADNLLLRNQLSVIPRPITRLPLYAPVVRCSYRQISTRVDAAPTDSRFDLSIRPVRDRLLITVREGARASTALIGPDGTLHDFNLLDDQGRRWTTESYGPGVGSGKLINQFMAVFPRYRQTYWNPGDTIAEVYSQDGKLWAQYVYRGLASYQGSDAAVLDLIVSQGGASVHVAFHLVDVRTMTPILYVFDAGFSMRLERETCT